MDNEKVEDILTVDGKDKQFSRTGKFRVTGVPGEGDVVSTNDSSSQPTITYVDGKMKVQDSPLVRETLARISAHQAKQLTDTRPTIPPDVHLVRSVRLESFERTGCLPLDETTEVVPKIDWETNVTLRGLFSISEGQTRRNAFKIAFRKVWAILTGRWS